MTKYLIRKYAREIIYQRSEAIDERQDIPADYQVVDVNSVDSEDIRSVGAEHVVYETIKELGLDRKLRSFGLTKMQLSLALGMIAGRMIFPGSERATHQWLLERSALDELMGVDLIKKVGIGGNFLTQRHSLRHLSTEQVQAIISDRRMRGAWEKRGAMTLIQAANERARELLNTHKPLPLPEGVKEEFKRIIKSAEE